MLEHYSAPAFPLIMMFVVQLLRRLRAWRFRHPSVGRALVRAVPLLCLLVLADQCLSCWYQPRDRTADRRAWYIRELEKTGERHLILVRNYQLTPELHVWLYNQADLEGATVVWARDLGPMENRALLEHYRGRRLWSLQADGDQVLLPYRPSDP